MSSLAPDTSVIVVNYNGRRHLSRCLEAIAGQEIVGGLETIVVDNASSDGTQALVRDAHPAVRLLELPRNAGFAAACNAGIAAARGRWLVLLNNDAVPRPGCLEALREAALANPKVAAVTAKLVYADRPAVIQNAGVLLLSDGAGADRGEGESDAGQYATREEVFGFCGAAALLRREALADAGTFDETFFMYYEDTDLSWRLRLRGWRILYEPAAVVEHVHAASSGEWSAFFTFHVDRNRLLMLLKNAPLGMLIRSLASLSRRAARGGGTAGHSVGAGVHGRVALSLLRLLPHALAERARIRLGRRVRDSSWKALLYPRDLWEARRGE